MPSSGPRLMVVRAKRRAGACTLRALTLLALPLPLRARYTDACRYELCCKQRKVIVFSSINLIKSQSVCIIHVITSGYYLNL